MFDSFQQKTLWTHIYFTVYLPIIFVDMLSETQHLFNLAFYPNHSLKHFQ